MELCFKDDTEETIVVKFLEQNIGARGLRDIMEYRLEDLIYEIPSDEDTIACTIICDAVEFTGKPKA